MMPGMSFLSRAVYTAVLCAVFGKAQTPAPKPIDPGKAALIEEMLTLNHSEQAVKQLLDQYRGTFKQAMEPSFVQTLRQQGVTDFSPYNADVQKFEERVFNMLAQRVTWERLKPGFVSVYDETFTPEELQNLVTFYKSPTGQVVLTKMPGLVTRTSQLTQAQVRDIVPDLQKMTKEFNDELKKKAAETKNETKK